MQKREGRGGTIEEKDQIKGGIIEEIENIGEEKTAERREEETKNIEETGSKEEIESKGETERRIETEERTDMREEGGKKIQENIGRKIIKDE